MRILLTLLLGMGGLCAHFENILEKDQTFVNTLAGKGLVKEIMLKNLSAVKCVEGSKLYLKADRIYPSEKGLMLLGDDESWVMLPKVYSDEAGCYIRTALICTYCACQYTANEVLIGCSKCRSD